MKTIKATDYQVIKKEAELVLQLQSKKFSFLNDYIQAALSEIEQKILNGAIQDSRDEYTIHETLKRTFLKPKKEVLDELRGRYKMLKELLSFLNQKVIKRDEVLGLLSKGRLKVDETK